MSFSSLTALGRKQLPSEIDVRGRRYAFHRVFKNDFFAITAQYAGNYDSVILKVHRQAPFLLLPLGWVGRILAARERACLAQLADLPGIPNLIGRWGPTGVVREYVPGHTLYRGDHVPDNFHPNLRTLIDSLHRRGMAYVDLEKCENVLVGDDGHPYLFDFQIAWYWPRRWGGDLWPLTLIRRWLQQGDRYHLVKLHRRTRPDQLTPAAIAASYHRPWHVRLQRLLTYPFTWCRRRVLDRIDPRRAAGERGRVPPDKLTRAA